MFIDKSKLHVSTQYKLYSLYNVHSICAIDAYGRKPGLQVPARPYFGL